MRILGLIILLSSVGISYTVAQRRLQNAAEVQPDSQSNPAGTTLRGRGRARFVKTPEFEQVSSDYAAASRATTSEGRSEGKSRTHPGAGTIRHNSIRTPSGSSTRRVYEVQEFVDDIPDRSAASAVYHRPRVITEDKFELPNAPRSKLFEPETNPIPQSNSDDLIKNFGSLRSDEPTKLELPQVLQPEYEDPSVLSSTTSKEDSSAEILSSTTEKEMERELLKKDQSTKQPESTTTGTSSTTNAPARRTIIRNRGNLARQQASENATPVAPSAPARTRGRSRTVSTEKSEVASPRSGPRESSEQESAPRSTFRVGRRRPIHNLNDRGPSVIEEDSQAPKTRTGRDSNVNPYASRRGGVRNTTPKESDISVEATTRNRADVRRSRGRKFETPSPTEAAAVNNNANKGTEYASRRTRTRTQPIIQEQPRASPRVDTTASGRSFSEPIRSRNQHETGTVPSAARESRVRTRSRFQLSDLENVKLEPQQSIEHSTRAIPRRQGRTRPPQVQNEELIASSTVENPIRVTLPSTSTIRSVNSIPTRVKESVHSEVSEVISSRKVTRRKKPEAKASAIKKSQEVEDDLDELNYPPQFKAIILANQSKSKDDKKLDSVSLSSSFSSVSSSHVESTPSTTAITTTSSTSPAPLTTSALIQAKHVEDVDNDLAPSPRPTRRRFSVSTRKPIKSEGIVSSSRKPKTLPTRKLVAHPDPDKIAKFHARFNTQYQRNNSNNDTVSSTPATTTTTKRTTKAPSKLSYTRKSDKLTERKLHQAPTKTNRYSSRYRSETRSSVPTRAAATTSPVYIPTVPTVTPGSVFVPSHQAPKTNDEDDDIKIISIAQPNANPLYSDNLVTENNTTVNSSDTTNSPTVSIIERIINSISSISTTSTAKPTGVDSTTESAILKIPPAPKKKVEESTRTQNKLTTEKPTTIIERILNSLSAIQASDNNVGTAIIGNNDLDSNLVVPVSPKVPSLVSATSRTSPPTTTTLRTISTSTTTTTTTTTPIPTTASTVKVAPAPTRLPSQSTVAISLADYLASLGLGNTQRSNAVASTTLLPTTMTTVVDLNKNTIDYLENVTKLVTTTESTTIESTTGAETTTRMPTTTSRPVTTSTIPTTTFNWFGRLFGLDTTTMIPTTNPTTTLMPPIITTTINNFDASTSAQTEISTISQSTTTMIESITPMIESTTFGANTLSIDITTPLANVSPNSVTITSPNDVNNPNIESIATNSNNRIGKALDKPFVDNISNAITTKNNNNATNAPSSSNDTITTTTMSPEDYFIFGVLPNNTIVRKRPRKLSAPYFIYGVYPNNTIVRKFPNGTIVPDDPVVQVSGFDTRDPLPPSPMITNRVTEPEGTDDARNSSDVNQPSVDLNNETSTLTGKTLKEYSNIINQTVTITTTTMAASTVTTEIDSAMSTTPESVTSTQTIDTSEIDDLNTIITERPIDLTTLNIPMMIELGPTTENPLSEYISTHETTTSENTISTTDSTEAVDVTTIMNDIKIDSRGGFEDIEDIEDTTLPMPDTSTIVMTSTIADTTITPDISSTPISTIWTVNPSSNRRFRLRLIRRRRPIRREFLEIIRTTTVPTTTSNELDNEIKNSGSTSRVIEILSSSTTAVPSLNRQTSTTPRGSDITSTLRFTESPEIFSTTIRPNTWFSTPITTIANWLSTTPLPTTMFATRKVTTTTPKTTTTAPPPTTTTTRPTTTLPSTTTPPTTTFRTTSTTDLSTFIANILSTLRPVYTPTTIPIPTSTETTTAPTITITARRRTTSTTTEPTTTRYNARRRTIPSTTEIPSTTSRIDTTTLDPRNVDIDEIVKNSKKTLTPEQLNEIEQLKALEREQANLLQQLSLLTNLNLNGQAQKPGSANLANRIVQFAKERDQTTSIPTTEIPTTRIPKKLPALDSKGTTVEDIIRELNAIQNSDGESKGSKSQEAIIAEILKQRGIVPSTPKSLGDAFKPTTTTTTRRPRPPTTQRPGRIMQGLSWLLNQFTAPQQPLPAPAPRPRPTTQRTTTTTTTTRATKPTTLKPDYDELHFQSTELNNVIHNTPSTTKLKRPVNSLSDAELSRLIAQLEAIQRDPKQAQNLDISPFRKLQQQQQTTTLNNVEIFTTGGGSNQGGRSQKAVEQQNGRVRTIKSTTSNSIEDLEEDNEVTTARVRTARPTRTRATLPPVELNPVPGLEDNSQGPQIGGNFLNAAVNVTRAISTFLGAAIQGAARSFQSVIGSGSSSNGGLFRASSG